MDEEAYKRRIAELEANNKKILSEKKEMLELFNEKDKEEDNR